jgi:hypothetical protein
MNKHLEKLFPGTARLTTLFLNRWTQDIFLDVKMYNMFTRTSINLVLLYYFLRINKAKMS